MATSVLTAMPSARDSFAKPSTLSSETLYQGKIITLQVDEVGTAQGERKRYEVVKHPGGVCVLPILNDGRLVFVEQYRYPIGDFLLELPAGKLDVAGESCLQAVKRELWEETGGVSAHWEDMGFIYTAPGFTDERITLFRADKVALMSEDFCNLEEGTQVIVLTWPEVMNRLAHNQCHDAKTLALLAMEFARRV